MSLRIIDKGLKVIKAAKISIKLTVLYTFMFCLVLLLSNASILYGVKFYIYNQANKQIEDTQFLILNEFELKGESLDILDKDIFSEVPANKNIYIRITNKTGEVINSSQKFAYEIKIPDKGVVKQEESERHFEDKERHFVYKNVEFNSKKYGDIYIQIIKDMYSEYNFLKILFVVMAVADFIGVIVSIGFGYLASKRMLRPIDHITKTAENISINNLKERIELKGADDELERLSKTFNKMIDRLQNSFESQTQFVSDASHELRTPIAVIQGYANLLDRWGKDDKNALEKSIHAIKLETANMAALVERLLFLAKGDSGTQKINKKVFRVNELISEVVDESRMIAQNCFITNSKNDIVEICADYDMLKQMLRIFIDNSIKFTSEHGNIDIKSEVQDTALKISVIDNGIGIPQDEIENIFNRFYIVDKSRSKEKGGTGLGLSIAKWIVEMHQGTVEVESKENEGTKIVVTFQLDT
ncbi:sensor histidine kinase [Inconstantimicrobium mannanitabidum]|uniref:Uncharacterized protein n=1 Tax=Inconstantimicrobium mannanitabidum TaxID=1604901 RepID=A0ACB5RAB1_9CLOT|nr:HAMP domain-containing histidine kinase [Clostridium sp. TW13]GKX65976.1 hypothetical protein rsdtw13_12340 [Clostridium sp. TW13]